jgi:hypothetical protein
MAGLFAPVEAIKRSVGLGEGYNYAKAAKIRFCPMLAVILAHWAPLLRWQAEGRQAQALPAEE